MKISTKNMFRKNVFLFFHFVYIFQVFTQQVSAPNSTLPGGQSKIFIFSEYKEFFISPYERELWDRFLSEVAKSKWIVLQDESFDWPRDFCMF